jgi:hypothetical protein
LLAKGKVVSNASRPVRTTRKGVAQQQDDGNAYYYVFNVDDNGGYVIVSGDDRTEPILGYVEQGTFDPDNMPENMQYSERYDQFVETSDKLREAVDGLDEVIDTIQEVIEM